MEIMPGFTLTDIKTSGAQIRLRHGGNGPPLLLLHGNPLTHLSWHAVAPRLAERFHVVAADLRGYGDDRLPTRHRRPWPQARSADPGAVGRSEQRRQTLCRPARLVEIARRRRPRRSATDRTLCERGGSRSGACLVPALL